MTMQKRIVLLVLCLILTATFAFARGQAQAGEFPNRDITMIVPWAPGGASDLIGRLLAAEMEGPLGVRIPVVNTPGAAGTIGMNDARLRPHDGYTIVVSSTPHTHGVMGMADWSPGDWNYLAAYFVPGIIAVHNDSPFRTVQELFNAIAANPDTITGGTAGVGSTGFVNMEVLISVIPQLRGYRHIAYAGGGPAVTATLAREVDFTPQLSNEMIDHLRAGTLRALAALTPEDLQLDGVPYVIPSIARAFPATAPLLPIGNAFGIMFPSTIPMDIQRSLEAAYLQACQSDAARRFATEMGVMLVGMTLEQSNALRDNDARRIGWILYDAGVAENSPAQFGVPR
jgi:tripartite-type tricarboxylate transporter receptor subunit TctC